MAMEVRTEDESPLRLADLALMKKYFVDLEYRMFWVAALALFLKYYLLDRVSPNSDRYWKRILKESDSSLRWWKPLVAIDSILTRLPLVRWMAWNIVVSGRKPDAS